MGMQAATRRSTCGVLLLIAWMSVLAFLCVSPALAQPEKSGSTAGPWGISSSAGSFRNHSEWLPRMAASGITTVRLFPEWRDFEPARGNWKWDRADALVEAAANNQIEINAILMGSPPGNKKVHAFPMDDLE